MLCDDCKRNEASYHEVREINGYRTDVHLCSSCAKKRGVKNDFSLFDSLLSGFSLDAFSSPQKITSSVCSKCGHTLENYYSTGLLGCKDCYDEFASYILPSLRNTQAKVMHAGKKPGSKPIVTKNPEYDKLKAQLAKFVEEEEYEKAAEIQEKIRKMEKEEK